jgi:hypothetical protein
MSITATMATNRTFILPRKEFAQPPRLPGLPCLVLSRLYFRQHSDIRHCLVERRMLAIAAALIVLPLSDRHEAAPA